LEGKPLTILESRPSLFPPLAAMAAISGLFGLLTLFTLIFSPKGFLFLILIAWLLCLAVLFLRALLDLAARGATLFVLKQDRLLVRQGLLRQRVKTLLTGRIQDVAVERGILARLAGYGNLRIESAGEHGLLVLPDVPNPQVWSEAILQAAQTHANTH